jgi:carotenoid cleavage dioxygenase
MQTESVANRFLSDLYAPVDRETTAFDLAVVAALPAELNGTYLRIGPNPLGTPDPASYHWFQGDGMVHAVTVEDGSVRYANRWVRTDRAATLLGEAVIASQPADVMPAEFSVANTSLVHHAGRALALMEVALPVEIRTDATTVGRFDFDGALRSSMTAHPKIDPRTGELHFFGYNIFGPPYLRYHVANSAGHLFRSEPISLHGPSMVHDFAITEHHVIWLDLPVLFAPSSGRFPYTWRPDYGARIGVMPRSGGDADVRWFEIDPCYVFHVLNAYDDGDAVVLDVCRFDRLFADDHTGPTDSLPILTRWTIPNSGSTVRADVIDERPQEFPRVADRTIGSRHRFGYAVTEHEIVQHDFDRGTTTSHHFGEAVETSEALFVPATHGTSDDEGWLVAITHDGTGAEFVVLDASAVDEGPIARVELPQPVPLGFHALWCDT